jgi:hypothetical protein
MSNLFEIDDEIVSIEYVGVQDTIDINTTGNRLFYANNILTHNSAVEQLEFDHSHIAGGLSKIQTADNVVGIFTSQAMRERGRYQIQLMKTRSSNGLNSKIEFEYNVNSLRITDLSEDEESISTASSTASIIDGLKRQGSVTTPANKVEVSPDTKASALNLRELLRKGSQ